MNEIYNINLWQIVLEGQNKLLPEDTVYQMIIGHSIKEDICELTMFISKINYENILNGVYNYDNLNFYQINDITKERQR